MPPVTTNPPTTELGRVASWTELSGWPWDQTEESPELTWPTSVRVFDRMRRSDSQVRACLWAVTLPLRRPIWSIDPQGARPEVVDQVAADFDLPVLGVERPPQPRRRDRFSWAEHLRLALLALVYGHMPFEQVYRVEGDAVRLRKLGPRFPPSLSGIKVAPDGGLMGVSQWISSAAGRSSPEVFIPVDRLVMYSVDREGAAWQGQSVLRVAYKDWLLKDRTMRVRAQTGERNGMGVPIVEAPPGATDPDLKKLDELAQKYRAGEAAGGAMPHGARLRLVGVEGTLPDLGKDIADYNTAIAKSVLAQFLELGTQGNTGNRALSAGFIDFFTAALDSFADFYADVTTQHAVEDYVDLNWGESEPAPAIVAREVDAERDIDPAALGELLKAGAITPDDDIQDFIRARYRLPRRRAEATRPAPASPVAAARTGGTVRVAATLADGAAASIAAALGAAVDADAILAALDAGATPAEAARAGVGGDASGLASALVAILTAAYTEGQAEAEAQLGDHARPSAGEGVAELAAGASVTAAGMLATLAGRLSTALAGGLDVDLSRSDLRAVLRAVPRDIDHARMAAENEARRATVRAHLDTYRANNIAETMWVRLSGHVEADLCEERHGTTSVAWEPLPPLHPHCLCDLQPAGEAAGALPVAADRA